MTTAISIQNVSKAYRLGVIGHGTLREDLQSWWARVRGKEDPNRIIGSKEAIEGDTLWALRDVSFDVEQGSVWGIIGRNGAGKSTLLKILSRVTAPTSGQIKVRGRVASLLEVGTGFHSELTGRENIFPNEAILGMSKVETPKKLDNIVVCFPPKSLASPEFHVFFVTLVVPAKSHFCRVNCKMSVIKREVTKNLGFPKKGIVGKGADGIGCPFVMECNGTTDVPNGFRAKRRMG